MNRQHEIKLIHNVQRDGCVKSFSELLKGLNLYRDIYLYVQKYLSNHSDVEEITQEVMFRAFERIDRFDTSRGRFRSWVLGIAAHKACDMLRSRKRQFTDIVEDLPVNHRSPEEMCALTEIEAYLLLALEGLQERPLRILGRFYVEGLSHEDIGDLEGLSANNVGTILYRARSKWLKKYRSLLDSAIPSHRREPSLHPVLQSFSQMFDVLNSQMANL